MIASLGQFPERTRLVGVYALGKAQRVIRLLRDAGPTRRSTSMARCAGSATITPPVNAGAPQGQPTADATLSRYAIRVDVPWIVTGLASIATHGLA